MAKREYKTASGKRIDFDTLALKGEETIAVGNMNVNARGDKLGEGGAVVKTREEVMADYYRIHNGTIPQDRPIPDGVPETNTPVADDVNAAAKKDPILSEVEEENPEEFISSDELASALASTAQVVNEEPKAEPKAEPTVESTPEVDEEVVSEEPKEQPRGGLASAVAKAKTSKPVVKEKTESQQIKSKPGVKRV